MNYNEYENAFWIAAFMIVVCGLGAIGAYLADWLEKHFPPTDKEI